MSVTIRIPPETHEQPQRIAADRKQPIGRIVADAVPKLESERFWDEMETAVDRLYADPAAAASYESERRAWDATLGDGLKNEPPYEPDGAE